MRGQTPGTGPNGERRCVPSILERLIFGMDVNLRFAIGNVVSSLGIIGHQKSRDPALIPFHYV